MNTLLRLITSVILNPLVLFAVALVTGIIGVLLVLDSPSYAARRARAEQLAPISATALADTAPGREVLLEGRISPHNQKVYRDFVAYVREEYRDELLDGDNTQEWVEVERVTPPLFVALPDGEARIANNTYTFDTTAVTVEEAAPTVTKGAVQSRGYVVDSPVLAIGKVGTSGTVEAEFVYAGTRAAYIEEMHRVATRSLPVGVISLLICVISLVTSFWQFRRFLREIAAERATEDAAAQERRQTVQGKRRGKVSH